MEEEEQLLPAAKRRRLDVDHEQQQDVIADSDEENEEQELPLEADVVDDTSLNDTEAPGDVSLTLLEADTSLPQPEEDEFDALYDDLDWDDGLLATDGETATQQIFSPKQTAIQAPPPHHPVSSPLKAGAAIDDDAEEAREEINASPAKSQQNASQPVDEDEAVYRAQEAAVAAKYGHLDYLNRFNALQTFNSPAPGGNSPFPSVGFTSVRGKVLVPSEESLAKASRLVQFSPDKEEIIESTNQDTATSADTPLPQRSRSALPFPPPGPSTSREASAPPTVSRLPKPSEDIPLRPLRYGPKNGHSLLPSRMPNIAPRHDEDQGQGHVPTAPPASSFAGFTSGSGKSVAMPSKEEAERLLANQDRNQEDPVSIHEPSSSPPQGYAGLSFAGGAAFKMPSKAMLDKERGKMNGDDRETNEDAAKETIEPNFESPARQVSAFSGLQSASGKAVALPSKEAIDKVISGLDEASKTTSTSTAGGFTTGGGKAVAQPTEEQIRAAAARLDRLDDDGGRADFPARQDEGVPAANGGLTSGGGRPIAAPTDEALAASNLRLNKDADAAHIQSEKLASTPARSALTTKGVNTLPRSQARAITPGPRSTTPGPALNKPFRLAVAGRASSAAPSTPARVPSTTQTGSAFQPRRLNLEMTPRNTPKSALNRSTFKTPFKNGQRPDPKVLEKLKEEGNRTMVTPGKNVDVVACQNVGTPPRAPPIAYVKADHKLAKNSVFDLYSE